jgi:hypothetical protein
MNKQYNVTQAKEIEGREKPIWIKHGRAFEKDGKIRIKLDSLPIPDQKGEIWLNLFEQDDNNNSGGGDSLPSGF